MGDLAVPIRGVELASETGELAVMGLFEGEGVRRPYCAMIGLEDCGSGCQLFLDRAWLLLATIRRPFELQRFVDELLLRGVTAVVVCAERSAGRGFDGYEEM